VRSAWKVVGAFAVLVLLGIGALKAGGAIARKGLPTRKTERIHRVFPDTVQSVDVSSSAGDVRVIGGEGPGTVVDAVTEFGSQRPAHSEKVQGDQLVIRGGSCRPLVSSQCSVNFSIRIPRSVPVTAASGGGDIAVSDISNVGGDVDLSSSGGDVQLDGASTKKVRMHSSGGDVTARGLVGESVHATSDGGDVSLSFAAGPVHVAADTSGGSVEIEIPRTPDAYRVDASSSGGDVVVQIRTDPGSSHVIRAFSSGGDVSIRYRD
jgi:Putative adhesin